MKIAPSIVKALRAQTFPDAHSRELRALFVAQILAYRVSFDGYKTVDEVIESHQEVFLDVLNAVNEFMPVDTVLAQSLYKRLVQSRWELVYAGGDLSLVRHALLSDVTRDRLPTNYRSLIESLTSLPTFGASMAQVIQSIAILQPQDGLDV